MTFMQTLIISIITAITTGILSILGVVLTLRQNNKQIQLQTKIHQEEKLQRIIDNRPELEIVCYSKKYLDIGARIELNDSKIECVYSPKMNEYPGNKKFVIVEYTLENIGKGVIEFIDFIALQSGVFLFDIKNAINCELDDMAYSTDGYVKSITYYGDKIRPHDKFKIRIWYSEDREPKNILTVSGCIAFKSFNKKYWRQNLYISDKTLEESVLITENDYNELTTRFI